MSAALVAAAILAGFVVADRLAQGPRGRRRWVLAAYGLLLGALGLELARWDHGHPDWLMALGFVGAPVVVIFGAAAEGARRWYGWPDFGPLPGRLALVLGLFLLGVLAGQRVKDADVGVSKERGRAVAERLRAWSASHGGSWPAALEDAVPAPPRTRMGLLDPPPFSWDAPRRILSFPVRTGATLSLAVDDVTASWRGS